MGRMGRMKSTYTEIGGARVPTKAKDCSLTRTEAGQLMEQVDSKKTTPINVP